MPGLACLLTLNSHLHLVCVNSEALFLPSAPTPSTSGSFSLPPPCFCRPLALSLPISFTLPPPLLPPLSPPQRILSEVNTVVHTLRSEAFMLRIDEQAAYSGTSTSTGTGAGTGTDAGTGTGTDTGTGAGTDAGTGTCSGATDAQAGKDQGEARHSTAHMPAGMSDGSQQGSHSASGGATPPNSGSSERVRARDPPAALPSWGEAGSTEEEEEATDFFSPALGNVVFASAMDGWAFSLDEFAAMWADRMGASRAALNRALWGDW